MILDVCPSLALGTDCMDATLEYLYSQNTSCTRCHVTGSSVYGRKQKLTKL